MAEMLTKAEIIERYPDSWILLDNPRSSDQLGILAGEVVFHSHDRDEVYRKAAEVESPRLAFLYTGSRPAGSAVLL